MLNGTNPIANDDFNASYGGIPCELNVLMNDSADPMSSIDYTSFELVQAPANGVVTDLNWGDVKYTPAEGYSGFDSFTYKFKDTSGNYSNVATVDIEVTAPDPPVATDDYITTMSGQTVVFLPLLNDYSSHAGLQNQSIELVTYPQNGNVTVNLGLGQMIYTPDPGYTGPDEFLYKMADENGQQSNQAKVTIDVMNMAPSILMTATDIGSGVWLFEGTVSDDHIEGVTVSFSGIIADEPPIQMDSSGTFSFDAVVDATLPVAATATATDAGGLTDEQSVLLYSF